MIRNFLARQWCGGLKEVGDANRRTSSLPVNAKLCQRLLSLSRPLQPHANSKQRSALLHNPSNASNYDDKPDQQAFLAPQHHPKRNSHLNLLIPPPTRNLVRHEINAVHLVRMPRKVHTNLVRLEIPQLRTQK